jgi:tyrosine-protein kinase
MEIDLRAYLRTLYKRRWTAISAFIALVALGVILTALMRPLYQAQTTLFVGDRQVAFEDAQEGVFVRNFSVGFIKSYIEIIKSRSIAQQAIADAQLNLTPGRLQGRLEAKQIVETQVIRMTYKGYDAEQTSRVTNAVADAFVKQIETLDTEGQPAIRVSVIDEAVTPSTPISPRPIRNITLAALLGAMLGVGLAFFVEVLDVTVKSREDVEALGLQLLGSIPFLDTHGETIHLERDLQGHGGEAFRMLRTSIGFINVESPLRSILVTSPAAQEGKTTTALNLAAAYAVGGLRTVLVEADLRRPSLHRVFGMVGTRGLTTAIVGDVGLDEAIVHTDMRNLSVILAGAIPPNPVELLSSEQMTDLLARLERSFDMVIIDSPPLVPVADPAALAGRCGGVVVVARSGKTDRRRLVEAVGVVDRAGGRRLGIVLNCVKPDETDGAYEYYYGYRSDQAPAAAGKE